MMKTACRSRGEVTFEDRVRDQRKTTFWFNDQLKGEESMTIADTVSSFFSELNSRLQERYYYCDHETKWDPTVGPRHSMFFARAAARKTGLPPWFQDIAEKEFPCSCELLKDLEKFVRAAIADLTARGEHHDAQNLRDRLEGFWDTELREAIEEVCRDDSEALDVVLRRFTKWQETGKRRSGRTLGHFVNQIDDILLVGVAREAVRKRKDSDFCSLYFFMHQVKPFIQAGGDPLGNYAYGDPL
jgi:hypothetical protein